MPCSDGRDRDGGCYENPETVKRLDTATRLLCFLCKKLDGQGEEPIDNQVFIENRDLFKWWQNHKKEDGKMQEEEKKQAALQKLTPEEIKLLKIKI